MAKPKVLITGATGLLGANLVRDWLSRWAITAIARNRHVTHPEVTSITVDICEGIADVVARVSPDVIVHTAAWTDLDACERNPASARRIHVDASRALATAAQAVRARFVYISTDAMFSGTGRHHETAPVDAQSVYAKTKLEGEHAVLDACSTALAIRTCIVGWNAQPKVSLVEWILRELRANRTISGFEDVHFTPILCNDLGRIIERLLAQRVSGVLHVAGSECISKFDFAQRVAKTFQLNPQLVTRSSVESAPLFAPRPRHPCLDSTECKKLLGDDLPDVRQTLVTMREFEQSGALTELRALLLA